jgi:hypothetical protein
MQIHENAVSCLRPVLYVHYAVFILTGFWLALRLDSFPQNVQSHIIVGFIIALVLSAIGIVWSRALLNRYANAVSTCLERFEIDEDEAKQDLISFAGRLQHRVMSYMEHPNQFDNEQQSAIISYDHARDAYDTMGLLPEGPDFDSAHRIDRSIRTPALIY